MTNAVRTKWGELIDMEAPLKVMVADDDEDFRGMIREFLEAENCTVIQAIDGADAVEQARRHRPDLILLDVMMPMMDGYNVCRALKQFRETAGISIIFLSVKKGLADKLCGYVAGAQRYLPKPFEMDDLLDCINNVMRHRGAVDGESEDGYSDSADAAF